MDTQVSTKRGKLWQDTGHGHFSLLFLYAKLRYLVFQIIVLKKPTSSPVPMNTLDAKEGGGRREEGGTMTAIFIIVVPIPTKVGRGIEWKS